jgi:hypothetical protein
MEHASGAMAHPSFPTVVNHTHVQRIDLLAERTGERIDMLSIWRSSMLVTGIHEILKAQQAKTRVLECSHRSILISGDAGNTTLNLKEQEDAVVSSV